MKIDADKLTVFLDKATLNSTILTVLIRIKDGKLTVFNRTMDNVVAVCATLNNVEGENQTWPIKDTRMFLNLLKLFSGTVEIKMSGNKLALLNAEKQVDYVLADETFIENAIPNLPKVEYEKKATIPSNVFKNIGKHKRILSTERTQFHVEDGVLYVETGSKSFDTILEKVKVDLPNAKIYLSDCANEIFTNLDDNVEIGIASDYPMWFRCTTPEYEIVFVSAQLEVEE
jgi:hypothetical protein